MAALAITRRMPSSQFPYITVLSQIQFVTSHESIRRGRLHCVRQRFAVFLQTLKRR
jgi:hypothetical protein